ncbi:MAG: hypothetical protein IPM81_01905 [Saprospirales bacterium]|nr:hypothetical protein [Saprospirales bacterium]
MTEEQKAKFWGSIVAQKNIKALIQKRRNPFIYESVLPESIDRYKEEGWEVDKEFKAKVRIKKIKAVDMSFEDEVWTTFANLGFNYLNKDRNFKMPYSDDFKLTQQIDVYAADSETMIFIECKSCEGEPKKGNFKEVIEAIGGKREDS